MRGEDESTVVVPFDMAEFLDSQEVIDEYLRQVCLGGCADEARRAAAYVAKVCALA
jgi:hypothetical protein